MPIKRGKNNYLSSSHLASESDDPLRSIPALEGPCGGELGGFLLMGFAVASSSDDPRRCIALGFLRRDWMESVVTELGLLGLIVSGSDALESARLRKRLSEVESIRYRARPDIPGIVLRINFGWAHC